MNCRIFRTVFDKRHNMSPSDEVAVIVPENVDIDTAFSEMNMRTVLSEYYNPSSGFVDPHAFSMRIRINDYGTKVRVKIKDIREGMSGLEEEYIFKPMAGCITAK